MVQARADEVGCLVARARAAGDPTIEETNVALASVVLDQLGRKGVRARSGEPLGAGLLDAETRLAARLVGRMERRDIDVSSSRVPVVFDGAHVPFNLAAVLHDLARIPQFAGPGVAVVALAVDKDAAGFLTELRKRTSAVVLTELPSTNRGRPAAELHRLAQALGLSSEVEPDPKGAFRRGLELARKAEAWLLVTGSLYLVGALRGEAVGEMR